MSHLIEVPQPLHRASYLGELQLFTCTAKNDSKGEAPRVYAFDLLIQDFGDPETKFQKHQHGVCELASKAKDGEPYALNFMLEGYRAKGRKIKGGAADPVGHIRRHADDLAYFVGDELAGELVDHMIAQYHLWVEDGKQYMFNPSGLWLKFSDMCRFNDLFLELCDRIASEAKVPFDRLGKARELVDFWNETEGEFNVPGQRSWYAENGPHHEGETQADFDADRRRFEELILEGQRAARELVSA